MKAAQELLLGDIHWVEREKAEEMMKNATETFEESL